MSKSFRFGALAARHGIPAAVALAGDAGKILFQSHHGHRDSQSGIKVNARSVFAIASMTKAVTAVAALQLVERGVLSLDEPAGAILPALRELPVLEGFTPTGRPRFSKTRYDVTLRQLLTHTAGFAYPWNHPLAHQYGTPPNAVPFLIHPPGTAWHYGVNIDWVGRVIEAAAGQSLEDYYRAHLFAPLGMDDTTFYLKPEQLDRFVSTWQRSPEGTLVESPRFQDPPPPFCNGGGGLFSTGADYLRFLQMILRRGRTETGEKILKASSIDALTANQIGTLEAGRMFTTRPERSRDVDFHPGESDRFSLAFLIHRKTGALSWAGIRNTFFWIDPRRGVAGVLLMQLLPFCDRSALSLLSALQRELSEPQ